MENKIVNLQVNDNIDETTKSVVSLKTQLRLAQQEVAQLSDKFGATSKEAVEAAKQAAVLKDKIGDAKALTDAFNPDAKFNALSASLGGVASGFAAYQGAMGLVGVESKDLEQQLFKVQSAMAIAQGLQGLGEARDSFKQLKAVGVNAFNAIKTAIGSTGIGLIVIAAGAIYAYWDDIKEAVSSVSAEQKKLNALSKRNLEQEQQKLDSFSLQENSLRLQGKSEKEILKMKISQTNQVIKASEVQIEQSIATAKAQTEAARRNQEILAGVLRFISIPLTLLLKTVDSIGKALGKDFGLEDKVFGGLSSLMFDPIKVKQDGDAVVAEQRKALAKLKSDRDGLQLSLNSIDKKSVDSSKESTKTITEEEDKRLEARKEYIDKQTEIEDEVQSAKDALILKQKYQWVDEVAANNQKNFNLVESNRQKLEAEKLLEQSKAEEEVAFQKAKDEAIANSRANLNNIIAGLEASGLAKTKAGQVISKAIALTQIGIDSAVAISKASTLANAEGTAAQLAFPLVPGIGTIARVVSYASTAASVIGNIARAKQLLSSGGGGGGGSAAGGAGGTSPIGAGGAGTTSAAPSFNVVGTSGQNQIAQSLGNQPPVKAFVVSNDVTTAQSLDRNIVNTATIGN
jgi:hypothetical protein